MKKLLCLLLTLCLLTGMCTALAELQTVYMMEEGASDVSLFGFDASTGTIESYLGTSGVVVIPAEIDGVPVTRISHNAFDACRDYTGTDMITNRTEWVPLYCVIIPETVTEIEDYAFEYCQQLETVVCYGPLATTGAATFYYCSALDTVLFPNGVEEIGSYAFQNCGPLSNLYFGDEVENIATMAFSFCGAENLYLNARHISNWAVKNCPALREVHFGAVGSADSCVIAYCPELSTFYFESGDLGWVEGDGLCGEVGMEQTAYVWPGTSAEDMERVGKKLNVWSMNTPVVTVEEDVCGEDHGILPGYDVPLIAETEPAVQQTAAPEDRVCDPELAGLWKLKSFEQDGKSYPAMLLGQNMELRLYPDGYVCVVSDDDDEDGYWYSTDTELTVVADGLTLNFTRGEADLSVQLGENLMHFTYQTAELPGHVSAVPAGTVAEADVIGLWTLDLLEEGGMQLHAADLGMVFTMDLRADGTAVSEAMGETAYGTWKIDEDEIEVTFEGEDEDFELINGELVIEDDGTVMHFVQGEVTASAPVTAGSAVYATEADVTGGWVLDSMTMEGMTISAAALGMDMTMTLAEDGSASMIAYGGEESSFGTWRIEDGSVIVDIDDEPVPFTYDGEKLYMDEDGAVMFFVRGEAAAPVVIDTPAGTVAEADVIGLWTLDLLEEGGMQLHAADLGMVFTMDLRADGTAVSEAMGETAYGTWKIDEDEIEVTFEGEDEDFELINGELVIEDDGTVMHFVQGEVTASAPVTAGSAVYATEADVTGGWVLDSMTMEGMTISAAALGMDMTMTLAEDGSASMIAYGGEESSFGTWRIEDGSVIVDVDDEPVPFTYDGEKLYMDEDGAVMFFVRGEASAIAAPAVPAAELTEADFMGAWTLETIGGMSAGEYGFTMKLTLNADGVACTESDEGTVYGSWYMEDGHIVASIDGEPVEFTLDGEKLCCEEDGITMIFTRGDFTGEWYAIYMKAGMMEGNPSDLYGLKITLTLNEDGTGCLDYAGPDEGMVWYRSAENGLYYYGTGEEDAADTPIAFNEEGYLLYGTEYSGYIIFSRDADDVAHILPGAAAEPDPTPAPVIIAEPTPAPQTNAVAASGFADYCGIKMIATKADMSGYVMDASMLGAEYSFTLNANGSCDMTIAGASVSGLSWFDNGDGTATINYYGMSLGLKLIGEGIEMNYFDSMLLTMEAAA